MTRYIFYALFRYRTCYYIIKYAMLNSGARLPTKSLADGSRQVKYFFSFLYHFRFSVIIFEKPAEAQTSLQS
jgi:hypothetical protein